MESEVTTGHAPRVGARGTHSRGDALWMYPGQGAQAPGMGARMLASYPPALAFVARAEELTGRPLRELCLKGPQAALNDSATLQPLWTALLLGCTSRLREHGMTPSAVAGHSLGEWAALAAAGVISDDDALRLTARRGALMADAARATPGGMLAVLDLDPAVVAALVDELGSAAGIVVANDNSARQQVASGAPEGLQRLSELVARRGGKARSLEVAGAWHCPTPALMEAAARFREDIEATEFRRAQVPVFLNSTGTADVDAVAIRAAMTAQIVSPVRWRGLIEEAHAWGCVAFLEVGPSRVLRALLRQILPDPQGYTAAVYDGATAPLSTLLAPPSKRRNVAEEVAL